MLNFFLQIWFQNRRAKFRKQNHKFSSSQSETRPSSTSSLESQPAHDNLFLGREHHSIGISMGCNQACCAMHVKQARPHACNCIECYQERIFFLEEQIHKQFLRDEKRRMESVRTRRPNSESCNRTPFCCCLKCREGTFYVQY